MVSGMADEWYRNPDWSEEAREAFERRLKRARPDGRAQYLYLKALALWKHGGDEQRRGARELSERVVNEYDSVHFAYYALKHLAEIADQEGSREEAIQHLRRAAALQPDRFEETELMLAEFLVASDDPECWKEAAALLERAGGPAFSMWRYRTAVLRARLAARAGDDLTAAANARIALAEATRRRPDFSRHPEIGWAEADSDTLKELQEWAEHMTPDQFLAWEEDQWR